MLKIKKEKSDIKFSEKFSLKVRKTIIVSKMLTILIVLVLIAAFIGLNVWVDKLDLPEIDVTANKIYTLSDESKKAIENIDQDIKIYVFGIDEDDSVVGLIKQYCETNDKISYEMLSSESNLEKVQEFELEDGYSIVVIESGESKKIIDASSEFTSYDYTTYEEVDTTEQTLTNSILGLSSENKPKVYFLEGHDEYGESELGVLTTYLQNEALECDTVNLTTTGAVPEDCDVLAIMSPSSDFLEGEVTAIIDYINKGGNIFFTSDIVTEDAQFPNIQLVLDEYGVSVENGYVLETDSSKVVSSYPYIFQPEISESNDITADIYSDSYMWLAYSEKLDFKTEEELSALNVEYEELLGSSDSSLYITDFSSDATQAASTAQSGHNTISALVTKTISEGTTTTDEETASEEDTESDDTTTDESEEESDAVESKMVIVANGRFITDYVVSEISSQYPLSYLGSNKDFAINAISTLGDKEMGITVRKNMAGASYAFTATEEQNRIVLSVIFSIPVIILLIGIIIWKHRKKRK